MKKETIILVLLVLGIGILSGMIFTNAKKDSVGNNPSVAAAPSIDYRQKIQALEKVVQQEPRNRNAWVQLGHNYFDSDQPVQAIDAYDQALALDGNDPNVLTDQGIMYRKVGLTDKAIANFSTANKLSPRHIQSLYNLGIVYRYDTKELDKAKEVWSRYLEITPTGDGAEQVRAMLNQM